MIDLLYNNLLVFKKLYYKVLIRVICLFMIFFQVFLFFIICFFSEIHG